MKFYAIKRGRVPGIYTDWSTASLQVNGYSGAVFKSFKTKEEAEKFLQADNENTNKVCNDSELDSLDFFTTGDSVDIYTDGSFDSLTNKIGAGFLVVKNNQVVDRQTAQYDGNHISGNNVVGELYAALNAMYYAYSRGYKRVVIHHDYTGVNYFATGDWKANKPVTKEYRKGYLKISNMIQIRFVKVKAHSGNIFGDEADRLSKIGTMV